jgi:hypothetical protein
MEAPRNATEATLVQIQNLGSEFIEILAKRAPRNADALTARIKIEEAVRLATRSLTLAVGGVR